MDLNFKELLEQVTEHLKAETKTDTVVGEPFTLGQFSCVPVIRFGMGYGTGGGGGEDDKGDHGEGGGAGAGMGIQPMGFLVTKGDEISFISTEKNKGLSQVFEKVPELLEKWMETRGKKEPKGKKEPAAAM